MGRGRIDICKECSNKREIAGKDLCRICYQRKWRAAQKRALDKLIENLIAENQRLKNKKTKGSN